MKKNKTVFKTLFLATFIFSTKLMAQESINENKDKDKTQKLVDEKKEISAENQWPIYFPAKGNSVEIGTPFISYEISNTKKNPFSVKIGNNVYSDGSYKVQYLNNFSLFTPEQISQFNLDNNKKYLFFNFESSLLNPTKLEFVAQNGEVLFEKSITQSSIQLIKEQSYLFIEFDLDKDGGKVKEKNQFRVCLKSEDPTYLNIICTGIVGFAKEDSKVDLKSVPSVQSNKFYFNNDERIDKGQLTSGSGVNRINIQFSSGANFQLSGEPNSLEIIDHIQNESGGLEILFRTEQPLGEDFELVDNSKDDSYFAKIGFQKTIWDERKLWRFSSKQKKFTLSLKGKGNLNFQQQINFQNPPTKLDRIYLKTKMTGTYVNEQSLSLLAPVDAKDFSSSNLQEINKEQGVYRWIFKAPNMDQYNLDSLEYTVNGVKRIGATELYRAYPRELCLRFSGQLIDNRATLMGEGYFQWWFNDLWGWDNYYFSNQRWGLDLRSFSSIGSIANSAADNTFSSINLSSSILNLKYRFAPGLWMRDESYGLILSTESLNLSSLQIQKYGAGVFWARSMPKIFDDLFNKISILRKQKWVDFEFINYMGVLSNDGAIGTDYALNFHGKMMVTERAYSDVGFGLKRYDISFAKDEASATIYTVYGTIGLGYIF